MFRVWRELPLGDELTGLYQLLTKWNIESYPLGEELRFFVCLKVAHLLHSICTSRVRALKPTSGLYLHSRASEGMWMGALQKHA